MKATREIIKSSSPDGRARAAPEIIGNTDGIIGLRTNKSVLMPPYRFAFNLIEDGVSGGDLFLTNVQGGV